MKKNSLFAVFFIMTLALGLLYFPVQAEKPAGEILEYEVISTEAGSWVVTAKEVQSGETVKFRLPPTAFKGQTFNAELSKMNLGKRFSVKGPKNVILKDMILETPLPGNQTKPSPNIRHRIPLNQILPWEIINVNARKWVVTARNKQSGAIAKFEVHPDAFIGFRFKADLRGIEKGKGFSIMTPNNQPMNNIATLLELNQ